MPIISRAFTVLILLFVFMFVFDLFYTAPELDINALKEKYSLYKEEIYEYYDHVIVSDADDLAAVSGEYFYNFSVTLDNTYTFNIQFHCLCSGKESFYIRWNCWHEDESFDDRGLEYFSILMNIFSKRKFRDDEIQNKFEDVLTDGYGRFSKDYHLELFSEDVINTLEYKGILK